MELDVIPVLEYTHPDALGQLTNADWIPQTVQCKALCGEDGNVVLLQYPFMLRDTRINYFTSNYPVSSFETDRKKFLGENEYGSFKDPLSLHQKTFSNSEAQRGDTMAALMHSLGVLQPGETKQIITILGQSRSMDEATPLIRKYQDPEAVHHALADLSGFWDGFLEGFRVDDRAGQTGEDHHRRRSERFCGESGDRHHFEQIGETGHRLESRAMGRRGSRKRRNGA